MKKNIIAISLIVSFLMVVIHEMIPHHHHEMDDIELFSHQQHNSKQDNISEPGTNNHFPFPAHHHVSAYDGFDIARIGTGLERDINFSVSGCFLISNYLSYIPESEPPESIFHSDLTVPKNSHPFIISPNAMRGSPSVG